MHWDKARIKSSYNGTMCAAVPFVVENFDNKELVFLTLNRPMRGYLYFRFITT
jgi:hypothetical protein